MSPHFVSPEFAEIPLYRNGESGKPIGLTRLRLEVTGQEGAYEVVLVDRAYSQYEQPRDVRVTSQGSFPTLAEARHAIDGFIVAYHDALQEDLIDRFRDAFNTLVCDPAARALRLPSPLDPSKIRAQVPA